ncbi:MAG TPA: HU family DNA-binding protein [Ignavibacteria bacterium]|nr:HU family DNA-binding protein [Ignavibacteria bacterium]
MNKQTLINKIIFKSNIDRQSSEKIIDKIFEVIKQEIISGNKIEIEGFGKFEKIHKGILRKENKRRKVEELLPPRDKVKFEPSDELLTELNN